MVACFPDFPPARPGRVSSRPAFLLLRFDLWFPPRLQGDPSHSRLLLVALVVAVEVEVEVGCVVDGSTWWIYKCSPAAG